MSILSKLSTKKDDKDSNRFNLIPDRPLRADEIENDRFGHREVAAMVFAVINKSKAPFTFGLFGRWGSGKTGIANLVEDEAARHGYKTVFFDVWKYQSDSLRRQFLIELHAKLIGDKDDFANKINQSLTIPTNISFFSVIKNFWKDTIFRFLIIFGALLIICWMATSTLNLLEQRGEIFSILKDFGLVAVFVGFILESLKTIHGSVQYSKTDSAEGFEKHFNEVLETLKNKKLLIIFDNLDRVEDKKAVEVLSDIKTFLSKENDNNNVYFLIPCDNEAIRQHLLSVYGNKFDADEFLRKFFNTAFNIPKFIDIDLNQYVRQILDLTGIEKFSDIFLEDIIVYAFRDNPREIKQFINSLVCIYQLGYQARNIEDLSISFLAKLLILRQKFPYFYSILEDNALHSAANLSDEWIDKLIKDYRESLSIRYETDIENLLITKEINDLKKFLGYTNTIDQDNIDVYLSLRQSKEEKDVAEWKSYVIAAEDGDKLNAVKILQKIIEDNKTSEFEQLLKVRLSQNKDGGLRISRFVSITIRAMEELNYPLRGFLFLASKHLLRLVTRENLFELFKPELVFNFWYNNIKPETRKKLVDPFSNFLVEINPENDMSSIRPFVFSLLDIISDKTDIFIHEKDNISLTIEKKLYEHEFITRIKSEQAKREFITDKAKSSFISSIDINKYFDSNDFGTSLNYLRDMNISKDQFYLSVKQLNSITIALSSNQDFNNRYVFAEFLSEFLSKHKEIISPDNNQDLVEYIQTMSSRIINYYNEAQSYLEKSRLVLSIDVLRGFSFNGQSTALGQRIEDFIKNASDDELLKTNESIVKNWSASFPSAFIDRAINRPKIIMDRELFNNFNDEQRMNLISRFLDNNLDPLDIIIKSNYQISDMAGVINKLINKLNAIHSTRLELVFRSLEKMGINSYPDKVQQFCDALILYRQDKQQEKNSIDKIIKKYKKLFNTAQLSTMFPD